MKVNEVKYFDIKKNPLKEGWEEGIHFTLKLWESLVRKLVHNNNSPSGKKFFRRSGHHP